MPILHKYKDKEGHYVLTSIHKTMVTFQLTPKGEEKLLSSGIRDRETFNRGLLLDLYRSGVAYTHGTGPGEEISTLDSRQLGFDFKNDPDPESLFPTCANCSSPIGQVIISSVPGMGSPFELYISTISRREAFCESQTT